MKIKSIISLFLTLAVLASFSVISANPADEVDSSVAANAVIAQNADLD